MGLAKIAATLLLQASLLFVTYCAKRNFFAFNTQLRKPPKRYFDAKIKIIFKQNTLNLIWWQMFEKISDDISFRKTAELPFPTPDTTANTEAVGRFLTKIINC